MLAAIAAVDEVLGLGCNGELQFHIRDDLKRFQSFTLEHTVIYGRKTLATFPGGRPLAGRRNIILSTRTDLAVEGAEIVHSVQEALSLCTGDAFVIGGASVYRQFLPYVDALYLTRVLAHAPHDAVFPPFDEDFFLAETGEERLDEKTGLRYRFVEYRRKKE